MILSAFSQDQPRATLCATRLPCAGYQHGDDSSCRCARMVKRFVTQSRPCPEKYRGQRIAIHAAKRKPGGLLGIQHTGQLDVGDFTVVRRSGGPGFVMLGQGRTLALPLGAVVATAVITASLPILPATWPKTGRIVVSPSSNYDDVLHVMDLDGLRYDDISDQLPYGDWTPGRYAWELTDVEPLAEPVPWKASGAWFTVELP